MTSLAALLDEYELSHKNSTNIAIHWIAEPIAIFALMALAESVLVLGVSLVWPMLVIMLSYFSWLSLRITLAFLPIVACFLLIIWWLNTALAPPAWRWALPLFVLSWLALLGGHRIEGRVPSVFQNPNLIFAGPVWLMRRIFRRLGLSDP